MHLYTGTFITYIVYTNSIHKPTTMKWKQLCLPSNLRNKILPVHLKPLVCLFLIPYAPKNHPEILL